MRIHRLVPPAIFCLAAWLLLPPAFVARARDSDWQVEKPSPPLASETDEPAALFQGPVLEQSGPPQQGVEAKSPRYDDGGVIDVPQLAVGEEKKANEKDEEPEPDFRRFSISLNPLNAGLNSISLNGKYMLGKHHGLMFTPSFWVAEKPALFSGFAEARGDIGIEVEYRFYTGNHGQMVFSWDRR